MARDIIEIQYDKKENKDEIYALWQSAFHDLDSFADYYFQWVYPKNQVLMAKQGNEILSMLHLNPYFWIWNSGRESRAFWLHYIVGVATKESCRRQGLMRRCMERALQDLAAAGEAFTYLMPAKKEYYEPFQFVTLTEERRIRIDGTGWRPDVDEEQCGTNFPLRDSEYRTRLQAEVQCEGGNLLEWGNGTGYCAYVLRREPEKLKIIVEQFFCPDDNRSVIWKEEIEPELYRRYGGICLEEGPNEVGRSPEGGLHRSRRAVRDYEGICLEEGPNEVGGSPEGGLHRSRRAVRNYEDICLEEGPNEVGGSPEGGLHRSREAVGNCEDIEIEYISAQTIMIRILNAEQFVELLSYNGKPKRLLVNLSDAICMNNNGKFLISLSTDGCRLIRQQGDEAMNGQIPVVNWNIFQLTEFLLKETRLAESIYLMEIV